MFGQITFLGQRLKDDCHLSFWQTVPLREVAMRPGEVEHYVQRAAQQAFADMIPRVRMRKNELDFSIEFLCDVYVFNPDEFWQIVEEAARDLNRRAPIVEPKEIKP